MSRRLSVWSLAVVLLVAGFAVPANAQGFLTRVAAQERSVQRMPMERRPNRFGHFYGNQVRRRDAGRIMINSNDFGTAARRYFYLP